MVCILQALASEARLLIMDEPTASLSEHERSVVFDAIRRLRDNHGTSVLFISHFLDEIMELCQHVTVLRDGVVVLDQPREQIDEQKLVVAIVGKEASLSVQRSAVSRGTGPVLEVQGLSSPNRIDGVEFAVEPGEIVGLAGLFGSGRSQTLYAIYGADHRASGVVKVDGPTSRSQNHGCSGSRNSHRSGGSDPAGPFRQRIDPLEYQLVQLRGGLCDGSVSRPAQGETAGRRDYLHVLRRLEDTSTSR